MADRIIEYGIIESDESAEELSDAVVNAIREGWVPTGGVAAWVARLPASGNPSTHYAQALVKYGPAE